MPLEFQRNRECWWVQRTLKTLVHAPVDTQTVFLFLHAPLAAAVVERLLLQGLHSIATFILGL